MTNKKDSNILFLSHDLRNNVGAAISHIQILTMLFPELPKDENIAAIVENLNEAISISEKISLVSSNNDSSEIVSNDDSKLTLFCLDDDYFKMVKASYDKLTTMHPVDIQFSYKTRNGNYFIKLDLDALISLRKNLITNSINAGATKIYAHYEMKEYGLIVTFKDNGDGMKQEDVDKLILSQHGDGVIHGVGTKSILNTAKENGFYISYTSDKEKGTTYRALCPYTKV